MSTEPSLGAAGGSPARRLSQLFEAQFSTGMGACSAPASPRLLPRRSRLGGPGPPPPPPPPRPTPPPPPPPPPLPLLHHHPHQHQHQQQHHHPLSAAVQLEMAALGEGMEGMGDAGCGGVNWQERCLELQLELHRFKHAAGRVRDSLRDKLTELERRVMEAETRAEEAEDRVRMMEHQLAVQTAAAAAAAAAAASGGGEGASGGVAGAGAVPAAGGGSSVAVVSTLSSAVREKETVINKLETAVEEQRQLRLHDARQVEAKAARIKEWVTHKLRELEAQNQLLREQNLRCTAQLELLRNHLAHSQLTGAGHRSSTGGSSSRASLSLEVTTTSDDSLGLPPPDLPTRPLSTTSLRPVSDGSGTSLDVAVGEPLYAEVERRNLGTHKFPERAASAGHQIGSDMDAADILSEDLQAAVDSLTLLTPCAQSSGSADDAVHDYAEIYTPSRERVPWLGSGTAPLSHGGGSTSSTNSGSVDGLGKPPTPPLHRFPSWESRIYQVAAEGLQVAGPRPQIPADGANNNNNSGGPGSGRQQLVSSAGYCDISVPVYATVKGRASQIRSMPFTGDSSDDSSDGEADHAAAVCADTSFESGMSDDYAIPPDALSCDSTSVESSLPSLLLRASSCLDSPSRRAPGESLEKAGHLAKLGGKLKTWRKRWFVLRNGVLTYWKSQNDVNRKPQGQIVLDDVCRITRADGAATFEISTGKKTYYLTADSIAAMEEWIRVLQNVQRRNATKLLLSREDNKPTIQGWLTKVKNGHAKKCWCMLIGKMFLYFKTPSDTSPMGQINMRDARVEEVDHVSDSDSEDREGEGAASELTIGIFPNHQGPTYLLMPNKQEKDSWLYHLTVVSGGGPNAGTQYEQLVQKLMETDGDPNCVLWRHPHLLHSKESIASPLTTLSSEVVQAEAVKLFKSCQLFISVALDSAGIDYHVVLAQNALQQCLDISELQAELVCALVKQTSRHTHHRLGVQVTASVAASKLKHPARATPPAGGPSGVGGLLDCKTNPPAFVFVQGWQLLALAVSLFVPRNNRLLWYLKLHLHRNADSKSECGKYAAYCQRALERTLQNGGREAKPSRMEVLSILLKNPYHHSLPHSIPVHMLNGTYQVVGFDGSTTIEEFLVTLNQEIGCRDTAHNGFTLFSDDPIEKDLEHFIDLNAKLCDVISKWETALREKGSGKFENTRIIQLTYKNRLYWRHGAKMETDRERLLLCYQVNQQVLLGRFPLNRELALELAALMAQIDLGEYNSDKGRGSGGVGGNPHHQVLTAIDKFYPYRYRDGLTQDELKDLQERLMEKWSSLKGRSVLDCVRIYLTCTRKWPFFGASLFQARLKQAPPSALVTAAADAPMVWLSVAEDAVTLLDLAAMQPLARYPYAGVVTFGGCQDDFMLVVGAEEPGGASQKLLFALSKPKILELTLLIADYMNAMGHTVPGTPQMGTLTRNGSHRSLRSRPTGGTTGTTAHTSTMSSTGGAGTLSNHHHHYHVHHAHHSHHHGGSGSQQQQQVQQPDILKSTPDHQLHRTDSKKRTHLDSGVA